MSGNSTGFHFSISAPLNIQLIPVLCLGTDICFVKTYVSAWKKTVGRVRAVLDILPSEEQKLTGGGPVDKDSMICLSCVQGSRNL